MTEAARRLLRSITDAVAPLGWAIAGLTFVTWLSASRLGWDELAVITTSLLILVVCCAAFAIGQLDLAATIEVSPSRVVVGDRAAGRLSVENRRSRSARALRVELPVGDAVAAYSIPKLVGGSATEELFIVPTQRRAVLQVGPITSVQGDPIGLFRRTRTWGDPESIYIHPKTAVLSNLAAGLIRDMEGQPTNELSPSDIAFHALRDYMPGDDRRHIHWKSSAKLGQLMVRQYVDTRRSHVAVALSVDLREYADDEEFELAISCAASVALQAIQEGQTLSVFAGREQLPTANPRQLLDRFSGIIGVRPYGTDDGGAGVASSLLSLRSHASEASVAVVCAGSAIDTASLRKATAWLPPEMSTVALRAAIGELSGYQVIGSTKVVNVPGLDRLASGLRAVAA